MTIFTITKTHPSGKVCEYHAIKETFIDMATFTVDVEIKSWELEQEAISNSDNYVTFIARILHAYWDENNLVDLESKVTNVEWFAKGEQYETVPVITLAEAKATKIKALNEHRDILEKSGFPYMGETIDSDIVSSIRISVATQSAQSSLQFSLPFEIDWITKNNTTLALDAMGMISMSAAFATYANSLHMTARAKKQLVNDAETIAEVEAVTWD